MFLYVLPAVNKFEASVCQTYSTTIWRTKRKNKNRYQTDKKDAQMYTRVWWDVRVQIGYPHCEITIENSQSPRVVT